MNNRMILRPPFSAPAGSDTSAGTAEISRVEALILAAWREQRYEAIVIILNAKMAGGLQVEFYDPLCRIESDE